MKQSDSRIKLITKPNGGVESERRAGLKMQGERGGGAAYKLSKKECL